MASLICNFITYSIWDRRKEWTNNKPYMWHKRYKLSLLSNYTLSKNKYKKYTKRKVRIVEIYWKVCSLACGGEVVSSRVQLKLCNKIKKLIQRELCNYIQLKSFTLSSINVIDFFLWCKYFNGKVNEFFKEIVGEGRAWWKNYLKKKPLQTFLCVVEQKREKIFGKFTQVTAKQTHTVLSRLT